MQQLRKGDIIRRTVPYGAPVGPFMQIISVGKHDVTAKVLGSELIVLIRRLRVFKYKVFTLYIPKAKFRAICENSEGSMITREYTPAWDKLYQECETGIGINNIVIRFKYAPKQNPLDEHIYGIPERMRIKYTQKRLEPHDVYIDKDKYINIERRFLLEISYFIVE